MNEELEVVKKENSQAQPEIVLAIPFLRYFMIYPKYWGSLPGADFNSPVNLRVNMKLNR